MGELTFASHTGLLGRSHLKLKVRGTGWLKPSSFSWLGMANSKTQANAGVVRKAAYEIRGYRAYIVLMGDGQNIRVA